MKKAIKIMISTFILLTFTFINVYASELIDETTFTITDEMLDENGEYIDSFIDDDGSLVTLKIYTENNIHDLTRSPETLNSGTYTRYASYSRTNQGQTAKIVLKFNATVSTSGSNRLFNPTITTLIKFPTRTGPTVTRQYSSSSSPARIYCSATSSMIGNSIVNVRMTVTLSHNDVLTISVVSNV